MTTPMHLGDEPLDIAIPTRRRKRARGASESAIQIAIRDALKILGVRSRHIPNAGKRSKAAGRRLKQEGMVAGTCDLIVWPSAFLRRRNGIAPGLCGWMECKTATGRLSPAQGEEHATLNDDGQRLAVVRSVDDALAALRAWGWVR